jgi:acetylxylan esterase
LQVHISYVQVFGTQAAQFITSKVVASNSTVTANGTSSGTSGTLSGTQKGSDASFER